MEKEETLEIGNMIIWAKWKILIEDLVIRCSWVERMIGITLGNLVVCGCFFCLVQATLSLLSCKMVSVGKKHRVPWNHSFCWQMLLCIQVALCRFGKDLNRAREVVFAAMVSVTCNFLCRVYCVVLCFHEVSPASLCFFKHRNQNA